MLTVTKWTHRCKLLQNLETQTSAEVTSWSSRSHQPTEGSISQDSGERWEVPRLASGRAPFNRGTERVLCLQPSRTICERSLAYHCQNSTEVVPDVIWALSIPRDTRSPSNVPVYWSNFPHLSQEKVIKQLTEFRSKREANVWLELRETISPSSALPKPS